MKQLVGKAWINSPEKRRQDVLIASALLPVVIPLGGVSLAAAWLEDGKKPLFRQRRIGKNGKPFGMYKTRTMQSTDYFGVSPGNVTQVGKVLRKLSLDEIPQIINIIKGEMSVVSPRPLTQLAINDMRDNLSNSEFNDWFRAYSLGSPGWFSEFGNKSQGTYAERAELDIAYMELASPDFDWQIIQEAINVGKQRLSGEI